MSDSLLFDAAGNDKIVFSNGNFAMTGAFTYGIVLKRTADANYDVLLSFELGATDYYFQVDNNGRFFAANVASIYFQQDGDPILNVADGWAMAVVTKAAGTVIQKLYLYKYSANNWSRTTATGGTTQANLTGLSAVKVGDQTDTIDLAASVLIAGFWDSELTESQIDTLITGTQAWINLSPDELFRLDSMSAISSETGTGTETSRTGTTLDVGDAPSGWADVSAPASTSGPRNVLLIGAG
jgi:hypothetical protein